MVSYAQNFEDVMLFRCFADRKDGFYIDVGAMDPTDDSVTKLFYDLGWCGINIEPNEFFFNKLMEERPRDINLKLAVGDRPEPRTLQVFERIGNSTFVATYGDRLIEQGCEAIEKTVRITTLASICQDYVKREIDFLKVDCEGWEASVLRGFDWEKHRPIIVIVEATEPNSQRPSWSDWEPILTDDGRYEMVYFDGLNRFYLRREYADLQSNFAAPPNVFDGFSLYATEEARRKTDALTREVDALSESAIRLSAVTEENGRLSELIHAREAQLTVLEAGITTQRAESVRLAGLLDISNTRILQLEAQLAQAEAQAETRQRELEEQLLKTRLWVGQLSQELAATKR